VNHWRVAIETHRLNYPDARAYCQDLATLNPLDVFGARDRVDLLWASPECTHHSNARGGRPRSEQGRASAWLILKWLSELYVRRVILENVSEFLQWGPLGADGKPLKSRRGETFKAFIAALQSMGYKVEWRLLCAADYGDPTTRTRLFVQAARGGARVVWPEPSHAKAPGLFATQPWRCAREIIDWSIPGQSIFDRKRPLAPATMQRIAAGIRRYWGEWAQPFLTAIDHTGSGLDRAYTLDDPLRTITTENRFALVQPFLRGGGGIVEAFILHQDAPGRPRPVGEPVPAIRSRNGHGLVRPFIVPYYGTGVADRVDYPLASVTGKDRFALVNGEPVALDITFRMLQPHELAAAQGFPDTYQFAGNKGDQVKQIGNAVPVNTSRALALSALGAA
jgi:DNA (cytosine-5)-methyltransferase 1